MTAPDENRSVTGEISTALSGLNCEDGFSKLPRETDKLAVARSIANTNTDHAGGTHFVITGGDNLGIGDGAHAPNSIRDAVCVIRTGPPMPIFDTPWNTWLIMVLCRCTLCFSMKLLVNSLRNASLSSADRTCVTGNNSRHSNRSPSRWRSACRCWRQM